ncbi:hypothetical protein [Asaia bogorensis]|uniref:Tail terminator n=1 Tax=Asaia bogorensis NBRC 16594 TaxID=1231624 RepID=A0AAN4U1P6_9PROT|nr:hypothetical protein [Asaia bogorensis]BAT18378.1 hypothetical protein Asbog_00061 [Asaia bogorensis NBRC 16594]GBQ74592.1 hypothetical protein AA0311_0583 [Asaia bogorensis NBRC 16594]GEL52724.1 hypothetical protein ABO01nite_07310 [Asaia bogorensis NBRC 16594]
MLSDTVWNDAYARASRVADQQSLPLVDVLMQPAEERPDIHWRMETQTSRSDRLGLGESAMEEEGEIALHLTMRVSRISTPDALTLCKTMSTMFRAQMREDAPWPDGLFYDGQSLYPPDPDATGNWISMSLMIRYRYQVYLL